MPFHATAITAAAAAAGTFLSAGRRQLLFGAARLLFPERWRPNEPQEYDLCANRYLVSLRHSEIQLAATRGGASEHHTVGLTIKVANSAKFTFPVFSTTYLSRKHPMYEERPSFTIHALGDVTQGAATPPPTHQCQ